MQNALVIEDNENNMELITFILESAGYTTIRAESGQKGYDLTASKRPDFIILDIQLPDIEGTEVLRMIRNNESLKSIPVIAVTSYAMSGDKERLLSSGCDGYIEKPIDPNLFIENIRNILLHTNR